MRPVPLSLCAASGPRAGTRRLEPGPRVRGYLCETLAVLQGATGAIGTALFVHDATTKTLQLLAMCRRVRSLNVQRDAQLAMWREPIPAVETFWGRIRNSYAHPSRHVLRNSCAPME